MADLTPMTLAERLSPGRVYESLRPPHRLEHSRGRAKHSTWPSFSGRWSVAGPGDTLGALTNGTPSSF